MNTAQKALDRIRKYIPYNTPLLYNSHLSEMIKGEVWLKCENLQLEGSFKIRGAFNHVIKLVNSQIIKGFCTHSSGNHGRALAYAAKKLGYPCTIVIPQNAPVIKKQGMLSNGAKLVECPPTNKDREMFLEEVIQKEGFTLVHPYDHEWTIEGQKTCAFEIFNQIPKIDYLFVPVGGGGLSAGSILTRNEMKLDTKIIGCEPELANDTYQSIKYGKRMGNNSSTTVADGLKAQVGKSNFPILQTGLNDIITLTENEIKQATKWTFSHTRMMVEPSSAVAIAGIFKKKEQLKGKKIACIITGGNVEPKTFENW